MRSVVIENCAIATMAGSGPTDTGAEYAGGHVVVVDGVITAVGEGPPPADTLPPGVRRIDGSGALLTPGLVNTHDHLYQWATRGHVVDGTLFEWLVALYPVWARIDAPVVAAAASSGLAWLALGGATTTADHHYVFPQGSDDLVGVLAASAARIGVRLTVARGSMDLGASSGGLPPDSLVEQTEAALIATEAAIDTYHDPRPGSMLQIAAAPCSPFTVTRELLTGAADLARRRGVRLHTHLAESADEDVFCAEHFGCSPVQHMENLGWLGPDVWFAHAVHLDAASIAKLAATGTSTAHCPSSNARLGAGVSPVRDLLSAGVPVGLGVDGAASHENGVLVEEMRQALYAARAEGGPRAMSVRQALWVATAGGARTLGRHGDVGAISVGRRGDLALWRLDGMAHRTIDDPIAALVLGPRPPLELLLVDGETVVERDTLTGADLGDLGDDLAAATRDLFARASR